VTTDYRGGRRGIERMTSVRRLRRESTPSPSLGEGWGEGVTTDYRGGRRGAERMTGVRHLRRGQFPFPLGEGWGEGVTTDYRGGRRGVERMTGVRRLRRESTDAERALWALVRDRRLDGAKFRRQHEFGPYVLDFYCPEQRLALEADGGQHYEPRRVQADHERASYLESQGVRVLRFTNLEILREREGVIGRIQQEMEKRPHPRPLPEGEGQTTEGEEVSRKGGVDGR